MSDVPPNPGNALSQLSEENRGIPAYYANGFGNGLSATEITTNFNFNGRPIVAVSLTYSLAKSLVAHLSEALSKYEKLAEQEVVSAEDIMQKMQDTNE